MKAAAGSWPTPTGSRGRVAPCRPGDAAYGGKTRAPPPPAPERLDRVARPARPTEGDLPRLVVPHPRAGMSTAREEVLARIRGLWATPPPPSTCHAYRTAGEQPAGTPVLVAQLVDRLEDYRATVIRGRRRHGDRRGDRSSAAAQRNPRGDRPGGRSGGMAARHTPLPEGRRDRDTARPRRRPRCGDRLGHRRRRDGDHRPRRQPALRPARHHPGARHPCVRRAGRRRGADRPRGPGPARPLPGPDPDQRPRPPATSSSAGSRASTAPAPSSSCSPAHLASAGPDRPTS